MDQDGTLKIDIDEWNRFFFLQPSRNLRDVLHAWRHSGVGDSITILINPFPQTTIFKQTTLKMTWGGGKIWTTSLIKGIMTEKGLKSF